MIKFAIVGMLVLIALAVTMVLLANIAVKVIDAKKKRDREKYK